MLRLHFKSFTLLWNFALVVFIIAINVLTCVTEKSVYSIFQVHSFYCDCLKLCTTCRLKIYANYGCTEHASLLLKIGLFFSKSPLTTQWSMCWKWCHYEALKENIDMSSSTTLWPQFLWDPGPINVCPCSNLRSHWLTDVIEARLMCLWLIILIKLTIY